MNRNTKYIQHFSTRIPWKDNDFMGKIDRNPRYNVAAQVIPNIGTTRNLEFEELHKGETYKQIGEINVQNWITENAAFMSDAKYILKLNHPYKNNERFKHFSETFFTVNEYSFLLRPFSWALKEHAIERKKHHNFYFDLEKTEQMLDWKSAWVSHGESQKGIFEYFFSGISPKNSLIFPYYTQVPFVEDGRRVIAGVGEILSSIELHTYDSDGSSAERNYIWETNVAHSIRENGESGFLIPYQEIYEYAKKNPDFDIKSVTVFEPEGFREEFSYAAEWVSYDAAIDVLNQMKCVLNNMIKLRLNQANHEWIITQLAYVDNHLEKVWNQRGIFPGLGSAIAALGLQYGFDISQYVDTSDNELITELSKYFSGEKTTGVEELDEQLAEKEDEFLGLIKIESKMHFFELLSRINLSVEQAKNAWKKFKENAEQIIENPYCLFEETRLQESEFQIAISQIDNAMFLNPLVINKYPLNTPTKMRSKTDKRRFRAMVINVLAQAAREGHTLLNYQQIIEAINKLPLDQKPEFQTEKIEGILEFLQHGELAINHDEQYIKLKEYQEYKTIIENIVNKRVKDQKVKKEQWRKIIDEKFGELNKNNEENDQKAREEKEKALVTMEVSGISVLLGRAGTGKTSALGIFSSIDSIRDGGVLALAPTGKARVKLEQAFAEAKEHIQFMTVAQFLMRSHGFCWQTMTYKIPTKQSTSIAETVIIDESSMLTEEMFAGILKLIDSHAERIIFTGDPNQLPPIGAGRPFIDLIYYLDDVFPNHVARLQTEMRQAISGDDLSFGKLFSNADDVDKDVLHRIQNGQTDHRLEFIQYDSLDDLEYVFNQELINVTNMKDKTDIAGFDESLGAIIDKYTNYRTAKHVEEWQVLSPTRFNGIGSYYLNNQIHLRYRQSTVDTWNKYPYNNNHPQSVQNIVFGDKVIVNVNGEQHCWDEVEKQKGEEYIANGELGLMIDYPSHYGKNDKNTKYYKFRFGSFDNKIFSYTKADFGNDNHDSKLELAYALTVHKSQGSSFDKVIVVINGKSSFLKKELLYTAFSRQTEKLIILSDLPIQEIIKYTSDWYSEVKQRYTDLFKTPNIIEVEDKQQKRYFEERLIHKTLQGEMVRSKSEVIIANLLAKLGIEYFYEKAYVLNEKNYLPDFTLKHQGRTAYLEHLGMLSNKKYAERWEMKKREYASAGISEAKGNLIITSDGPNGSLDSKIIEKSIRDWMNRKK